jgi:NADH:ubiquinone oxidoreductase subunit
MSNSAVHNFGFVDETGDIFEFHWNDDKGGQCKLEAIVQTERGPRRSQIASIPVRVWNAVSIRAVRELTEGMDATERPKKAPDLKNGTNRLGPLIGRELAVLLWALMEVGGDENVETILHGWRELAREERWWLYAKAAAPGQRIGAGWRLALFHALSEIPDSRATEPVTTEKKSPGNGLRSCRKSGKKKKQGGKQRPASKQTPKSKIQPATPRKRKQPLKPPSTSLKGSVVKNRVEKKAKRVVRKTAQNN